MTSLHEALRAWAETLEWKLFDTADDPEWAKEHKDELLARLEAFARDWEAQDQALGSVAEAKAWGTELAAVTAERDTLKHAATALVQQLNATCAERDALKVERDKWLANFNRSEQFQSGPTKRAEEAEAQLAAGEAARAALRDNIVHLQRFGEGPAGATYRKPEKGFTYVRLDEVLDWLAASAPERTT